MTGTHEEIRTNYGALIAQVGELQAQIKEKDKQLQASHEHRDTLMALIVEKKPELMAEYTEMRKNKDKAATEAAAVNTDVYDAGYAGGASAMSATDRSFQKSS